MNALTRKDHGLYRFCVLPVCPEFPPSLANCSQPCHRLEISPPAGSLSSWPAHCTTRREERTRRRKRRRNCRHQRRRRSRRSTTRAWGSLSWMRLPGWLREFERETSLQHSEDKFRLLNQTVNHHKRRADGMQGCLL